MIYFISKHLWTERVLRGLRLPSPPRWAELSCLCSNTQCRSFTSGLRFSVLIEYCWNMSRTYANVSFFLSRHNQPFKTLNPIKFWTISPIWYLYICTPIICIYTTWEVWLFIIVVSASSTISRGFSRHQIWMLGGLLNQVMALHTGLSVIYPGLQTRLWDPQVITTHIKDSSGFIF